MRHAFHSPITALRAAAQNAFRGNPFTLSTFPARSARALCTSVDRSGWRRLKPERTLPTCSVLRPHAFNMAGSEETNLPSSLGIRKHLGSAGHFGAAPRSAFKISGQAYRAWFQRSMGKRALPWICSSAVASWPRRAGRTILLRGRGVVVPHLLGRRKGLGSNPNVCIHQGCSGNLTRDLSHPKRESCH